MKKHFIIIFMLALYMTMASGCAGAKIVPSPNEERLENNPMVGATVAVAVSIEEAAKNGKF